MSAIHEQLRQEILSGIWKAGDRLPSEVELAERFGCSAGTVNKAAALLAHAGLIDRRRRAGMRVLPPPTTGAGAKLDAFAFIFPSELHEGVFRMVRGFQLAAQVHAKRVVTLTTGADGTRELELVSRLSEFGVLGAAIAPLIASVEDQLKLTQCVLGSKLPVVFCGVNLPGVGRGSVQVDDFHAGHTMTRHLLQRGLTRIGFFSNYALTQFTRDRHQGYRWAMQEAGIIPHDSWVDLTAEMHPNFSDPLNEPTELARRYLARLGEAAERLEGVVCANDFLACGLMRAAQERGLRVPRNLKVTGIDDYITPPPPLPALTTYRVPYEDIGRGAWSRLEESTTGTTALPATTLIQGQLVVRESA